MPLKITAQARAAVEEAVKLRVAAVADQAARPASPARADQLAAAGRRIAAGRRRAIARRASPASGSPSGLTT